MKKAIFLIIGLGLIMGLSDPLLSSEATKAPNALFKSEEGIKGPSVLIKSEAVELQATPSRPVPSGDKFNLKPTFLSSTHVLRPGWIYGADLSGSRGEGFFLSSAFVGSYVWGASSRKMNGDSLSVVKWDFGAEFGLAIHGSPATQDYFAVRYHPTEDFMLNSPCYVTGASLFLIDFDTPTSGYETYTLYLTEDDNGHPNIDDAHRLALKDFPAYYGDGGVYAYFANVYFDTPVEIDTGDPIWLVLYLNWNPSPPDPGDYGGPVLAADIDVYTDYVGGQVIDLGGDSRRYRDSFFTDDSVTWTEVGPNFNPVFHEPINMCMDLLVEDQLAKAKDVDNIFTQDQVNMTLVPMHRVPSNPDSLEPITGLSLTDSLSLEFLYTNNSADSARGEICEFGGVIFIINQPSDTVWAAAFCDSYCVQGGGGHGVISTFTDLKDTLGNNIPTTGGQYKIVSISYMSEFTSDTTCTLYVDQSQANDTLVTYFLAYEHEDDDYEPNNTFAQAHQINCGDTLEANIKDPDDKDYFKFTLDDPPDSMHYIISLDVDTDSATHILNSELLLYDANQQLLTSNQDHCGQPYSDPRNEDPFLRFPVKKAGTYYLLVQGEGGSVCSYTLETRCFPDTVSSYKRTSDWDLEARGTGWIADGAYIPAGVYPEFDGHTTVSEGETLIVWVEIGGPGCLLLLDWHTDELIDWTSLENIQPAGMPYSRGVAFDVRGGTFWIGDWGSATAPAMLHHIQWVSGGAAIEMPPSPWVAADFGLPTDDMNIAGLAIDHDNNHLWATFSTADPPDLMEIDITDPANPTLIQTCTAPTSQSYFSGAGLAYDDSSDKLLAINQAWGGLHNYVEGFLDGNPPSPVCPVYEDRAFLYPTIYGWGIAEIDGSVDEGYLFWTVDIASAIGPCDRGFASGHFPVDFLDKECIVTEAGFIRGDVDASGGYTLGDGLYFLNYFFSGSPTPPCNDAADIDDSGGHTLGDGLYFLNFFFSGSPAIPPPSGSPPADCGPDPTPDALDCVSFPPCGTKGEIIPSEPLVSVKGAKDKVVVRDAEVQDGEVVVPVELVNVEDITGVDITLGYDASILKAEKVEGGADYDYFVGYTGEAGKVRIGVVPDFEMRDAIGAGDRVIAEVVFKVKGALGDGVKVSVEMADLYSKGVKQVKSEWIGGLVKPGVGLPTEFALRQNYPNPFNAVTQIRYDLPVDCQVTLDVYNVVGQRVATLMDSHQKAGYKVISWNAQDIASGVYFYKLTASDFTSIRKMILLK